MSQETMPNPDQRTPREIRDWQIYDLTGIDPDPRGKVPIEETKQMVQGVQAGNPEAKEKLLAARIGWVYDKYVENDTLKQREDLEPVDILQAGSVAILEAAKEVNAEAPNFYQSLITMTRRRIVGQIMGGKMLPTISEKGHKLTNARYEHEEERMLEAIAPVGDKADVAVAGHGTIVNHGTPEKAVLALETPSILARSMKALDKTERKIIEARFGLTKFDEGEPRLTRTEIGEWLGLNRESVRKTEIRALDELREAYERLTDGQKSRLTKEQRLALQQTWLEEIKQKPEVGDTAFVMGSLLERQQEILRQRWFEEIRRKQAAGKIAFVVGSMLEGELPDPVFFYLLTDYEGEDGPPAPSVDLQAAIREAAEEEFREHRLTSVAA